MPHSLEQEVAQMGSKWKIRRQGRKAKARHGEGGRCLLQQVLVVSAGNSIGIKIFSS